jgi:hypothetical protein
VFSKRVFHYFLIFFAIFLAPIPYVSLATFCGMVTCLLLNKFDLFSKRVLMFAVLMILGVLISARLNDTEINYEETKRLIGIIAAAFNFIFFSNYFNKVIKSEEDRISAILFLSFAFVFTTYFWYSVKIVGDGNSYPWLKFYGALPVAFFLVQMSRHPLFSKIKMFTAVSGMACGFLFYLNGAKSAALLVTFGSLALQKYAFQKNIKKQDSSYAAGRTFSQFRFFLFALTSTVFASVIWYSGDQGYFGAGARSTFSTYGGNFFTAIINARPELRISLAAIGEMPWYGFGTPENGMRFALGSFVSAGEIGSVNSFLINKRALGDGLNVHSWFFEMILRVGFIQLLLFVPLIFCLISVLKRPNLFANLPGLYIVCLFTTWDLFFSPFTWFSPLQIAFALMAFQIMKYRLMLSKE